MNDKLHPALAEHAMERENERLRGLLAQLSKAPQAGEVMTRERLAAICEVGHDRSAFVAALSQQAEPVCRCTMSQRVLGDGCWVCNPELAAELAAEVEDGEPAPAQDEREAFEKEFPRIAYAPAAYWSDEHQRYIGHGDAFENNGSAYQRRFEQWKLERNARPAQTEQQPSIKKGNPEAWTVTAGGTRSDREYVVVRRSLLEAIEACEWRGEMAASSGDELRAVMAGRITYDPYPAPIAQTEHSGQAVRELLAAMNHDGGQHQHEVGIAQAARDALAEFDRIRQQLAEKSEQSGLSPELLQRVLSALNQGATSFKSIKAVRDEFRAALSIQGSSKP